MPSAWLGCGLRHRRARPDEWTAAGIFERLAELMLTAPNEMIGLQCDELSLDGSIPSATERGPRERAGAAGGRAADNGVAYGDDGHHPGGIP
jgi:hypothetical protein